jgi:pimeloyl-ACP methyl ester carboxylesterase
LSTRNLWVPAEGYAEALHRFSALRSFERDQITPAGQSGFWSQMERRPLAVVLFHGLTNCPEQWSPFASQLHARGHNVIVPRLPGHGYRDRTAKQIARVHAGDYLQRAGEAVDIALGAGERVAVAGISLGGALAARLAADRADVASAVCVSPMIGIKHLSRDANAALLAALELVPNAFLPWDLTGANTQVPVYAYPRFPTHGLAATLRLGLESLDLAERRAPAARETIMVLNANEPATNNVLAERLVAAAAGHRDGAARTVTLDGLPFNHDIIDPTNALARTGLVYPELLAAIEGAGVP